MTGTAGVADVTDADFTARVLESELPVLVQFTAVWCGPCRMLKPVLADIAREEAERLTVVQIDVDANTETTQRYAVLSTPTLMVFRGGEPVLSTVGAKPKRLLLRELANVLD
ncbi:thioredoxin domain-containing protein [Streptomyces sp. NPDC048057]|uniref:thioredoxin family protein n=1 Tax=Streptomyces sp. NPDC048057 TaxID=3155628 RepID=UPI0033C6ECF5